MIEKFMVFDTETTNDIDCPIMYDFGFAVIDRKGKVYQKGSFVVADVFLDKELMESAYFAEKIPMYWEQIKSGQRELKRLANIRKIVLDAMKEFNIKSPLNADFFYLSGSPLSVANRILIISIIQQFDLKKVVKILTIYLSQNY